MLVSRKLPHVCQIYQWLALKRCPVALNEINHFWLADKEATTNPATVSAGFLAEGDNTFAFNIQGTIAFPWLNGGDGRFDVARAVKRNKGADVYIADAITICQTKWTV